jgi:hypothetical protein
MIFHAHCLNPFSFTADLATFFENLLDAGIEFPLERLHTLIKTGMNSDAESQLQWNNYHLEHGYDVALVPYQLSTDLPHTLGDMDSWKTSGIYVTCPWCSSDAVLDLTSFTAMRLGRSLSNCSNCNTSFDASTFTSKMLLNDLTCYTRTNDIRYASVSQYKKSLKIIANWIL